MMTAAHIQPFQAGQQVAVLLDKGVQYLLQIVAVALAEGVEVQSFDARGESVREFVGILAEA